VQFSDCVQLDIHNMATGEIDHVSSVVVTFTFPKLSLVINTELLQVVVYAMNSPFGN
jgi:hypothetical protein